MKIHEEAGSVPNERIEIKSTDLIRHRPTGNVIIVLYIGQHNSYNSLVGANDSSIYRSADVSGWSGERIESFASPVFHLTARRIFSRRTFLTENKYLCTVYKVGGKNRSARSVKSPTVVTVDLARAPTRKNVPRFTLCRQIRQKKEVFRILDFLLTHSMPFSSLL